MELRTQLQDTLGDAYTLERELTGGGMSIVFLAEERALARKVVVKVLPADLSGGVNIERFKREIQVAARLQHAHIVPVLAAGETSGLPYYTMPFVQGESLRSRLIRSGALSITDSISILRDVARALAYAHAEGRRPPRHQARQCAAGRWQRRRDRLRYRESVERVARRE